MTLRALFNNHLDKLIRPEVHMLHRPVSAFKVCGYVGGILTVILAMSLGANRGLSLWVIAGILITAVVTFFSLAMATKVITGEEKLVYYYQEIGIMTMAAILLWLLHQRLLSYLDITILGIGTFLVCGRIGCLMVGCCHGRPHSWGVCYREEHVVSGFTPYYIGVRLFPIQAVESLWVCCIVLQGSILVLSKSSPGTTLVWYVIAYDLGRFCFEFMRGDPERPYFWDFSEAQWISLLLMCVVVGAELFGILPFQLWHAVSLVILVLAILAIALSRHFRKTAKHQLLHPHHVKEIAEIVELLLLRPTSERNICSTGVDIGSTSQGIQISASTLHSTTGWIYHYTLSSKQGVMTEDTAKTLALLIRQLKHQVGSDELIRRDQGIFHLLIHSSSD